MYSRDMPDGELKEDGVQCYKRGSKVLATCYICPSNSTFLVTVMPDFVCGNSRLKRDTVTDFFGKPCPLIFSAQVRLARLKWSCCPICAQINIFYLKCSCIDKPIWKWQSTVAQAFHWTLREQGGLEHINWNSLPIGCTWWPTNQVFWLVAGS